MPARKRPKRGSRGFYPKKRAKRIYPRIKHWPVLPTNKLLGFAGYKVGMTHALVIDTNPNTRTIGQPIAKAVTILDCPSLKVFGFRCYNKSKTARDIFSEKLDKRLERKLKVLKQIKPKVPKQIKPKELPKEITAVRALCHTQPGFKKKPEIFELAIGGSVEKQLECAKSMLGKEIKISEIFKQGDFVDVLAVTKGKGFSGPVKRFGVRMHGRKARQMHRHVAPLGQKEPGKVRSTVPQAGQLGFQTRTELNKKILEIGFDVNKISQSGGYLNYGKISGEYVLIQGSVPGPRKQLIMLRSAIRPSEERYPVDIKYLSTKSKQGV